MKFLMKNSLSVVYLTGNTNGLRRTDSEQPGFTGWGSRGDAVLPFGYSVGRYLTFGKIIFYISLFAHCLKLGAITSVESTTYQSRDKPVNRCFCNSM